MATFTPNKAGPQNIRELYYYVYKELQRLGGMLGDIDDLGGGGGGGPETDPIFSASPAAGISAGDITYWDEKYGKDNSVGTVSVDGSGNPTGAAIENGETADGWYTKTLDGSIWQNSVVLTTTYISTDELELTWTLPEEMANTDYHVAATIYAYDVANSTHGIVREVVTRTTTSVTLRWFADSHFGASDSLDVSLFVFGRWWAGTTADVDSLNTQAGDELLLQNGDQLLLQSAA